MWALSFCPQACRLQSAPEYPEVHISISRAVLAIELWRPPSRIPVGKDRRVKDRNSSDQRIPCFDCISQVLAAVRAGLPVAYSETNE
jgi:hypothetical protein